jgi:hypothetical protein
MRRSATKLRPARIFGWWYACIAVGFLLLGVRSILGHEGAWSIALHAIISAGFAVLAWITLRASRHQT